MYKENDSKVIIKSISRQSKVDSVVRKRVV